MKELLPLILIVGGLYVVIFILKNMFGGRGGREEKQKRLYQYKKKQFFMTRAEHEFYDALMVVVGNEFYIFAQVHLPTLLDNKVVGQDWRAALAHINRKSVDFVLCDKTYLSPKLAIELDDKSHERPDRQERDTEVEQILKDVGMPLLRIENHGSFDSAELALRIKKSLDMAI